MDRPRRAAIALTFVMVAAYAAARFWRLTEACLWFDEIFSVHAAEHGWGEILNFVALDLIHPPLFYLLLKLWIALGGEGLFWLRLFPVLFSLIAVFPFLRLCNELKIGKWTRLLALFLFAVNGSAIKYSQEVRMYAPLMCLSLFSLWLFARYFVKGKSLVALIIVNVLMVYTHYFGWLVVGTEVAAILIFQRIKWRPVMLMFGIVTTAFLPWLITVISIGYSMPRVSENIGWIARPGLRDVGIFVMALFEPFYYQTVTTEPASIFRVTIPIVLLTVLAAAMLGARLKGQGEEQRRALYLLAIFVTVPVAAAFGVSWIAPHSVWGTRHLMIVFGPAAVLVASAFASVRPAWARTLMIALLILFKGYGLAVTLGRPPSVAVWCGFDELARQINSERREPIYLFEDLAAYHVWFTTRDDLSQPPAKITDAAEMPEDTAFFLPRGFDGVRRVTSTEISDERLWIIYRGLPPDAGSPPLNRFAAMGYAAGEVKTVPHKAGAIYAVYLVRSLR